MGGLKTGGGSDIPQGTQGGVRPLVSQALHQPGPQQWPWGPSLTSQRSPNLRLTPLPHSPWTSDVLTCQVQETMFLEEPPAMVKIQKLCNSPRGKERKGYVCVCTYLSPYVSSIPHISHMGTCTLHTQIFLYAHVCRSPHSCVHTGMCKTLISTGIHTYTSHLSYIKMHLQSTHTTYTNRHTCTTASYGLT